MKAAAPVTIGLALALGPLAAAGSSAAAPAAPAPGDPPGMLLYKSLPLSGRMSGVVQIQCTDSLHCEVRRSTEQLAGSAGSLEVWQDAGINPKLRTRLWGQQGGPIQFGGEPAHPALLVLRSASGSILAQSMAETPLVDLEPLFLGASTPTFLISIDYRTPQTAIITRGILQVDPAAASLGYAAYSGPQSASVIQPDGTIATIAVPGPQGVIEFDSNFTLDTDASAHTAQLTVSGCYPNTYVNYRTRGSVSTVLTVHARYELRDGTWNRQAQLNYDNCGGLFVPETSRVRNH